MTELLVPRENVNDESVTIVKVLLESGSNIKKGEVIVELETTKVNIDIESPRDGVLVHNLSDGDIILVGAVLCTVSDTAEEAVTSREEAMLKQNNLSGSKAVISKSARQRALELNVDLSVVDSGMISVADVERMARDQSDNQDYLIGIDGLEILKNSIIIVGGGGHAKMCIDLLNQSDEYDILGIVDDKLQLGTDVLGVKVVGDARLLNTLAKLGVQFAVNGVGSITNPKLRYKIHQNLMSIGFRLPNLIHPSSVVEPSVHMGHGNQIMMGAIVGSDVQIGHGCIVNSGSVISHDCILRDHCHVAPGAVLAGSVDVGENSVIGMGVTVYMGLTVGSGAMIFNGVNVFKNISEEKIVDGQGSS